MFSSVCVSALLDTGSDITIISESLRRSLGVVATPWSGSVPCGADGFSFSCAPLAVCNLRFTLNNDNFFQPAVVFPTCACDLILGWDFLSSNAFLLQCYADSLPSPLVSDCYFSSNFDSISPPVIRSQLTASTIVPAKSAVYVSISFSPPLPDNTSVLLTPISCVLSKHSVMIPHVLTTLWKNSCLGHRACHSIYSL